MAFLARRHLVLGCLVLAVLLLWFRHQLLLPGIGEGLPPSDNDKAPGDEHLVEYYGADYDGDAKQASLSTKYGHESSNETLPRFWTSTSEQLLSGATEWKRPDKVKAVMGLVFYGRRETVSVLDCYLKRNLLKNGGVLDGVIFVERTDDKNDLDLLHKLLRSEPDYILWEIDMSKGDGFRAGFGNSYEKIEDDVLYVKIDDDIVFIEDTTIPSIVETVMNRPDLYIVSANIVNQPMLSWIHWNLGAVKPWLPDLDKRNTVPEYSRTNWRPSSLPNWRGRSDFAVKDWTAPLKGCHRWLPIRHRKKSILDITPIVKTEYDAFGEGWKQWHIGAQEHYSLLENIEMNELWRYKFHLWDFQYSRMGIQLVAMMGRDINIAKPIERDDEEQLSVTMPKKLGRHAVADGRGIAAHFAFGSQRGGMRTTDVLERYRGFARENICASPMLWESSADDPY